MEVQELIDGYPRLYHMAALGSWKNIEKHGLLSTTALLDLYGINGAERTAIESAHRPECITIKADGMPDAVVRDQKPMSDNGLTQALKDSGLTPQDWYEILNSKVFFWASENRLDTLLNARAYANLEHDVLIVDSASLIKAHEANILLCPYNSGCTRPNPWQRDKGIFKPIKDYDPSVRKGRKGRNPVVELCVEGGVPGIAKYVISVNKMRDGKVLENIYSAPRVTAPSTYV